MDVKCGFYRKWNKHFMVGIKKICQRKVFLFCVGLCENLLKNHFKKFLFQCSQYDGEEQNRRKVYGRFPT